MAVAPLMPAVMTRTAWSAGTALEALAGATASTAAFRTTATIVGATSTAVWTATAIVAAAIPSTTAEGALETLARIATNACGVARKFFARRGCASCAARCAGFSGQQDDVVLDDMRRGGGRSEIVGRDIPGVGVLRFFLAVSSLVMAFVMFVARGMLFFVKSKCGVVLGALVRGIRFGFGTIGRATFFNLGSFIVGKLRNFGGMGLFGFVL